jgi:membrane protease YdiL (CAAX protease family)
MIRKIWSVTWRICLFLLAWGVLLAPLIVPVSRPSQLYLELASASTVFVAAAIMRCGVERQPLVSLGFQPKHLARDLAAGLVIGTAMMAAIGIARFSPPALAGLGMLAIVTITNAFSQELLVRGYIQQTLRSRFGAAASIVTSAVLFMLLHAAVIKAPLFAINLFLAGLLLGIAYALTGNLWLPIAIHFGWNFLQGVLGVAVEGGLPATIVTLLGIAAVVLLFGRTYSIRQMASEAP